MRKEKKMTDKKKILLMDGFSLAFRAFYGMHGQLHSMKNARGLHTNALFALNNMFQSILKQLEPTHALVAFDAGKTTFRHEFFDDYKGGRDSMPPELSEQIPYFKDLLAGFGLKEYELENYEADDIIGTLTLEAEKNGDEVIVLTGDRDLTQLASDTTTIYFTKKGVTNVEEITAESLKEEMGIEPWQVIELKGLMGDQSDNIPGVTGIGEKTALKLLDEYGSIENLYDHIDEMNKSKRKENLIKEKDIAFLSKKLATIDRQAPITIGLDDLDYPGPNVEALVSFYREMDFQSQLERLDTADYLDELNDHEEEISYQFLDQVNEEHFSDEMALYLEMLDENYLQSPVEVVAWGDEDQVYVAETKTALESEAFKAFIENPEKKKLVFDAKATAAALHRHGIQMENVDFDILLADYLLTATDSRQDVYDVAQNHQYQDLAPDESIYGKGKSKGLPDDLEKMHDHVARKIKAILSLTDQLAQKLVDNEQVDLLKEVELPLSKVLLEMELRGITVDAATLKEMQEEFAEILTNIEEAIYEKAGEEFNINSPKQLGVILFEKMGYTPIRKTKTGYSTAVDVLEKLQDEAPIVEDILNYRQIAKIQSTYVEGLLKDIDEEGKVHTRFLQTVARTGRLSSQDPNLQNIPIRTEEGRKVRQAFTANHEGWYIFTSDYSQIELRVMAHISGDEHMIEAFRNNEDIHTSTARRIFFLDENDEVTGNMRRDAKAINFGIIYGMSDYGLSESLGITRKEAKDYIDTYFDRFSGVKQYIDDIIREAKNQGYVETLFNRRRYLPEINSSNFNQRSFAERTAMNTPIQGSAADIIKIAMIQVQERLKQEKMQANMLLQVHDELIFEVPEEEIDQLTQLVEEVMTQVVDLKVPLEVESSYGKNWYQA